MKQFLCVLILVFGIGFSIDKPEQQTIQTASTKFEKSKDFCIIHPDDETCKNYSSEVDCPKATQKPRMMKVENFIINCEEASCEDLEI